MRQVFALPGKVQIRAMDVKKNRRAHRYFEMFLRPFTILEAQVKESDFAPDDGQAPKDDEGLLDDVGAGDPRHRLSFTVEPHESKERLADGMRKLEGRNHLHASKDDDVYVKPHYYNNGKAWPLFPIAVCAVRILIHFGPLVRWHGRRGVPFSVLPAGSTRDNVIALLATLAWTVRTRRILRPRVFWRRFGRCLFLVVLPTEGVFRVGCT